MTIRLNLTGRLVTECSIELRGQFAAAQLCQKFVKQAKPLFCRQLNDYNTLASEF